MAEPSGAKTIKRPKNVARLVLDVELEYDDVKWPQDATDRLRAALQNIAPQDWKRITDQIEVLAEARVFHMQALAAK